MKIIKFEKYPNKENYFRAVLIPDKGEDLKETKVIKLNERRFEVKKSLKSMMQEIPYKYTVELKEIIKQTAGNYESINFLWIEKIERTSIKTIRITQPRITTDITFDNSEECLQEFLLLRNMQKEALSNERN